MAADAAFAITGEPRRSSIDGYFRVCSRRFGSWAFTIPRSLRAYDAADSESAAIWPRGLIEAVQSIKFQLGSSKSVLRLAWMEN